MKDEIVPFMLRHTSLIAGLAVGVAVAAGFSMVSEKRVHQATSVSSETSQSADIPVLAPKETPAR